MSTLVKVAGLPGNGALGIENLKRPTNGTIEAEKARLRKATQEFESFFVYQMLKAMRKTIPENSLSKDTPMSGGMGKDTFTELFDMEIARKATFGGHNSIAELLYKSTEKLIDARFETKTETPPLKPLRPAEKPPTKLDQKQALPLPRRSSQPIKISQKTELVPLGRRPQATTSDPIMNRFGSLIEEAARETKLDSALISSVIRAESNGDPNAVSPAGAKGLMQLIDSTARELKVQDAFDPRQNIRAGSRYLRQMLDRFGDLKLALAAYNAGPGNVTKHGGMPPFKETRTYVRRVTDFMAAQTAK